MATSLTTYGCSVASSTLATAGTLASALGGVSSTSNTIIGTNTQYIELYGLGGTGVASGASIGTPSGKGFLWDVTTLEAMQLLAGTWTPTVRGRLSSHTCTADVILRAYKRSSGGVYTNIGTWTVTAQSWNTANTNYSPTPSSVSLVNFGVGDKLYEDVWLNITASTMTGSDSVQLAVSSTSSGLANNVQLLTPSYQPIPVGGSLMSMMGVG